jgi:hypothetical protein
MSSGGTIIFSVTPSKNVIVSIYVRVYINVLHSLELCYRDKTMARVTYVSGGSTKELAVTSAHHLHDHQHKPRNCGPSSTAAIVGERNSSLDVLQMHITLYG